MQMTSRVFEGGLSRFQMRMIGWSEDAARVLIAHVMDDSVSVAFLVAEIRCFLHPLG